VEMCTGDDTCGQVRLGFDIHVAFNKQPIRCDNLLIFCSSLALLHDIKRNLEQSMRLRCTRDMTLYDVHFEFTL